MLASLTLDVVTTFVRSTGKTNHQMNKFITLYERMAVHGTMHGTTRSSTVYRTGSQSWQPNAARRSQRRSFATAVCRVVHQCVARHRRDRHHLFHRLGQDSIHRRARASIISVLVCEKKQRLGRSAESAAFISEFYLLQKNPTRPVNSLASPVCASAECMCCRMPGELTGRVCEGDIRTTFSDNWTPSCTRFT
eukprot:COSAG02_NODE_2647_length_8336_cov_10.959087_6_plen_193_part_00